MSPTQVCTDDALPVAAAKSAVVACVDALAAAATVSVVSAAALCAATSAAGVPDVSFVTLLILVAVPLAASVAYYALDSSDVLADASKLLACDVLVACSADVQTGDVAAYPET